MGDLYCSRPSAIAWLDSTSSSLSAGKLGSLCEPERGLLVLSVAELELLILGYARRTANSAVWYKARPKVLGARGSPLRHSVDTRLLSTSLSSSEVAVRGEGGLPGYP